MFLSFRVAWLRLCCVLLGSAFRSWFAVRLCHVLSFHLVLDCIFADHLAFVLLDTRDPRYYSLIPQDFGRLSS